MNANLAWPDYSGQDGHKLLSDNRDRYIAQSAATRNGEVAQIPLSRPPAGVTHPLPSGRRWAGFFSRT